MDANLERLRSIKGFPQLVTYLRDELDWEFETEHVEDLTYEYSPGEFERHQKRMPAVSTKSRTTVSGLTSGTRYWFRVAAVNANGQSGWSDPATKIAP